MKVSIVTVCFNSVETIRDTIESVLAQDYDNIEYIIVDGASTDGTLDVIEQYKNNIAYVISELDDGIYDAMNKGIALASGDVVGILNSDDFFSSKSSVSSLMCGFEKGADAVYADLVYVDKNEESKLSRLYSSAKFSKWKIRFGFMVPHPTFYAKRELFSKFGNYKLNYRVAADFELMTRFFNAQVKTKRVNEIVIAMREGGISSSGLKWRFHQNLEIVRACRENGIYTNILLLAIKVPFKILSFFMKPKDFIK